MPTIKDVEVIPAHNRNQFKKFIEMLSETELGVSITYSTTPYRNSNTRFDYTAICDTRDIAVTIQEKIKEGAFAHGA